MTITKFLLAIPTDYKVYLEKIAAMQTIETGEFCSLTKLIIETLEKEFQLNTLENESR